MSVKKAKSVWYYFVDPDGIANLTVIQR